MNYSVTVYLSSGMEVPFGSDLSSPEEIKESIIYGSKDPWYNYSNASGNGYFKRSEVIMINTSKK